MDIHQYITSGDKNLHFCVYVREQEINETQKKMDVDLNDGDDHDKGTIKTWSLAATEIFRGVVFGDHGCGLRR